ncbi:MAG: CHAT domain-containing protein [Rhodospirillales bacterium]|jgi:CHAT domain-containing protein|nr:CHAT domain-containing protein [Rhodospirillales bacterium]
MRIRLTFGLSLVTAIVLGACQTTVSVEEAKQVSTEFSKGAFVPPPRTITDISAILDQQKTTEAEKTRKHRERIAKAAPSTNNPSKLARFYWKKGGSEARLGKSDQALTDFRKAASYLPQAKLRPKDRHGILKSLAQAEAGSGRFLDGIRIMEKAIEVLPSPVAYRSLVRLYIVAGNFKAAQKARDRGKALIARISGKRGGLPPEARAKFAIEGARMDIEIFQAQGQWKKAEARLRDAITLFKSGIGEEKNPSWLPMQKTNLAKILLKQGRLIEAEVVAREGLLKVLSTVGRNNGTTADVARKLAEVLHAQGREDEAEKLIRTVLDIHKKIGTRASSRKAAQASRLLGTILVAQEDWDGAMVEFDQIRSNLQSNRALFKKMFAHSPALSVALIRTGRSEEVLAMLPHIYEKAKKRAGKKQFNTAKLGSLLAMAHAATDKPREALVHFREAVPILLTRSRQADDETTGDTTSETWISLILEGYIGVLTDIRGSDLEAEFELDAAAEAFRMADAARNRSIQRAVAASGARSLAGTPELADLVRREQDAQKQISAQYAVLADVLGAPTDQQDADVVHALRVQIDALRGARASMMNEIETKFPEYASMLNPKPDTIEEARAVLRPGEALISTYVGRERTFVWSIPAEGAYAFAAAELDREDLEDLVGLIRSSLEPNAATLGDIPPFEVDVAFSLFDELFVPVESGWRDAKDLLIVAHGPLGYLPPALLPTEPVALEPDDGALFSNHRDVPWLIKSHSVTMLPSVASLRTLRSLPAGKKGRKAFAGFGDPIFNASDAGTRPAETKPAAGQTVATRGIPVHLRAAPKTAGLNDAGIGDLPRLTDTAEEIRSMALALEADLTRDVFMGTNANERTVKTLDLSGYKVLAFATHGLIPGDINGLAQPALALSSPDVANVDGDGLLTMGEILSLRLDADWVVLSACNTGSGRGAGAEAVSGLGRAFFYAGTRSLLVSNWPVETTSARILTTDLFRRQAEKPDLSRAQALREAMLGLVEAPGYVDAEGRIVFSYAHPIFWAPFSLIGDGGGHRPTS